MTKDRRIATAIAIALAMSVTSIQFGPLWMKKEIQAPSTALQQSAQTDDGFQSLLTYGQALDSLICAKTAERESIQKQFYRRLAIAVAKQDGRFTWSILYGIWMRESRLDQNNFKGDGTPDTNGVILWRAFGVGQVHIPTGKSHYDLNVTENDLLDPVKGGFASGRVLGDYIDMFHGDDIAGISAYNQGPAPTRNQIRNHQTYKNLSYVTDVLYYAVSALVRDSTDVSTNELPALVASNTP